MAFFSDATSSRSGAVSSLFTDMLRGVGNLFSLVVRYRRYAKAEAQLLSMTDRQLEDLGIARGEIRARVWANFDRR
ncbi:hypothetical protein MNBD_ALPHA09-1422 [hydrothermal vent metagenome]|uniref:YjiS-like domain-containing protein n=1 Tax=hydrothermal vent metagenome TaxID=652676 RepID=A0A3B0TC18_9ZZZZ